MIFLVLTALMYQSRDCINQSIDQYLVPDARPEVKLPEDNRSTRALAVPHAPRRGLTRWSSRSDGSWRVG